LHFLPLPLAGWVADREREGARVLAGAAIGWAFALAYTSAINQAFDDRLDARQRSKNPVGPTFDRRRAVALALPPLVAALIALATLAPSGLAIGATMMAAATLYSAPPRLKRIPVVGTLWNVVIGVPGLFFAGWPRAPEPPFKLLVGLFATLLLGSQLIHEAQDRDDDSGHVRTVATEVGRRAALGAAMLVVLAAPAIAWWLGARVEHRLPIAGACAIFSVTWAALLAAHLRTEDVARLKRLRLWYRYAAVALGGVVFAVAVRPPP
jgi:4-hydroxybenzoate polyprenyltransferase